MKIDVAVFIAFDCQSGFISSTPNLGHAAGTRTFTMRYDTEDMNAPAQFCNHYPPRADAYWMTDKDGVLFALHATDTDKKIRSRAERFPVDYCSDPAEGEALQEAADDAAAANGQFGVGA